MSLASAVATAASYLPALGARNALSVLCYHRIVDAREPDAGRFTVTAEAFEAHLDAIAATGRPVVPLPRLEVAAGPGVALTFDDNSPSHLLAAERLAERGLTATFFLNPGELGRDGSLDRPDVDRLLELGMGVGAHGVRHRRLVDLDAVELAADVAACRHFLDDLSQPPLWAYPGGDPGSFTPAQDRMLRDAGFAVRLTTLEGPYRPGRPDEPRSRYVIRGDSTVRYVTAAARGGLQLVGALKRARHLLRRSGS